MMPFTFVNAHKIWKVSVEFGCSYKTQLKSLLWSCEEHVSVTFFQCDTLWVSLIASFIIASY